MKTTVMNRSTTMTAQHLSGRMGARTVGAPARTRETRARHPAVLATVLVAALFEVVLPAEGAAPPPPTATPSPAATPSPTATSSPTATPSQAATGGEVGYRAAIEAWRKDQEEELRADGGWLTVAGLFWLKEGANRFGTDPTNDILLPPGSAPDLAGVLDFRSGITTVTMESGVPAAAGGKALTTTTTLRPDNPGPPDVLTLNALTMTVIKRGDRYGIRLKDKNRKERRTFGGRHWFPVRETYRVRADFVPYDPPRKIPITNVLGQTESLPCPGYASFTLEGQQLRLEPVGEADDKELFFIFRDRTSGKGTYGAGRFLNGERTEEGKVVLDFNTAYSPPCAFSPYATCPLPPKQNALPIRIEAGEKSSGH